MVRYPCHIFMRKNTGYIPYYLRYKIDVENGEYSGTWEDYYYKDKPFKKVNKRERLKRMRENK